MFLVLISVRSSLKPQQALNLLVTEELSSLLQVNVYVTHNLLNVIGNKMGFKKNSVRG
jgi:hypothetical protein